MLQPTVIPYNTGENTETILNSSILKQNTYRRVKKKWKKKPVSP